MDERVIAALRCPHPRCDDGGALGVEGRSLRCGRGHTYDRARQGYVDLLYGRDPGTGDDAAMVAARERVLGAGRFAPVTDAVGDVLAAHLPSALRPATVASADDPGSRSSAVAGVGPAPSGPAGDPADGLLVDLGTGTGHHLAGLLERFDALAGLGIDLSRPALRRAARCHPRAGAVVADVWASLPLRDHAAAAVTCIFAPRNAAEIARVLAPGGVLVTVTPAPDHLGRLVEDLGLLAVETEKGARLVARFAPNLVPRADVVAVHATWQLSHDEVVAVVAMGPSADHLDADRLAAAVAALPEPVEVPLSVEVRAFGRVR